MTKLTIFERAALLSSLSMLFTGCTSLTGLDAGSTFSCNVPDGIPCQNVESAYRGSLSDSAALRRFPRTEGKKAQRTIEDCPECGSETRKASPSDYQRVALRASEGNPTPAPLVPSSAREEEHWGGSREVFYTPDGDSLLTLPRRVPERVLTLFVAPWTDRDGDLHEGEVLYVTVSRSHWAEGGRRAYYAQKKSIRHVGELTRTPAARLRAETPVTAPVKAPVAHPMSEPITRPVPAPQKSAPLWVEDSGEENVIRDGDGHPVLNGERQPLRQMSPVEAVSAAQDARAAIHNAFAARGNVEEPLR